MVSSHRRDIADESLAKASAARSSLDSTSTRKLKRKRDKTHSESNPNEDAASTAGSSRRPDVPAAHDPHQDHDFNETFTTAIEDSTMAAESFQALGNTLLNDIPASSNEASDDEAPQAIANDQIQASIVATDSRRSAELKILQASAASKRRERDERLKKQKQLRKVNDGTIATADTAAQVTESTQLPRFLPDEVLQAQLGHVGYAQEVAGSRHKVFESEEIPSVIQKGPLSVSVVSVSRNDLAPRAKESTQETKNSWLYKRGGDRRRPLKNALV